MKRRASKVRPGMTVQTSNQQVLIEEVRDVGGMTCFRGSVAGLGSPVAFSAHPSDTLVVSPGRP